MFEKQDDELEIQARSIVCESGGGGGQTHPKNHEKQKKKRVKNTQKQIKTSPKNQEVPNPWRERG